MSMSDEDLEKLARAFKTLENPSLAMRLSSAVGMPIEAVTRELGKRMPTVIVDAVSESAHKAIELVFQNSIRTLKGDAQAPASPKLHTAAAMTTGAVGGFFGLSSLVVELPLTTVIMFRSIVDIARAEGETPSDPETMLNCMQVFATGSGASDKDDAAETSYYGVRMALGKALTDAMQYVATYGVGSAGAPALTRAGCVDQ